VEREKLADLWMLLQPDRMAQIYIN